MAITVERRAPDAAAVRALAAVVEKRDGGPPLSDQALTQLAAPGVTHFSAADGGRLVGYAQIAGGILELVAEPSGYEPLLDTAETTTTRVWTHGAHSPLAAALAARGYERTRILHRLELLTFDDVAAVPAPADVHIRPFRVGVDEDAWLAVNAAAFADHPEQGRWMRADLAAREAEPWFDPAGFLLAQRGPDVLGFHWTKIHADGRGEVYVIGVGPAAQGSGLGGVLLAAGLRHLRDQGCPSVLLYVDDTNANALRLYERMGFVRADVDVQWSPATAV